jgi:hypothetical protein
LGDAQVAIEVKSAGNAGKRTRGLHLFLDEVKTEKSIIVSIEPLPRKLESGVTILPWQLFCEQL